MGQDLRKMLKEEREAKKFKLKEGHEERFLKKLGERSPKPRKPSFFFVKVAASILVMIGMGTLAYKMAPETEDPVKTTIVDTKDGSGKEQGISLGDLSPDLQKVEAYYVANINLELSKLEVSEDNKIMVDGFMDRLSELDAEYKRLNTELNRIGPNDQTINALIMNLQIRLQLLHKLKTKLNEIKTSKNEQETNTI